MKKFIVSSLIIGMSLGCIPQAKAITLDDPAMIGLLGLGAFAGLIGCIADSTKNSEQEKPKTENNISKTVATNAAGAVCAVTLLGMFCLLILLLPNPSSSKSENKEITV